MPYTYPGQVFDGRMNALKGWPFDHALDIEGTLSENVDINSDGTPPNSGTIVHISDVTAPASGKPGPSTPIFEMGAKSGNSDNVYHVPLVLWPSGGDFDVTNPGVPAGNALGGSVSVPPAHVQVIPTGKLVALVALGAFELETTEFDTDQDYLPGQPLRAVTSNTDANAGKLTNVNAVTNQTFTGSSAGTNSGYIVIYVDTIVGWVSRGTYTNAYGKTVLAFWPDFLPGTR